MFTSIACWEQIEEYGLPLSMKKFVLTFNAMPRTSVPGGTGPLRWLSMNMGHNRINNSAPPNKISGKMSLQPDGDRDRVCDRQ